MHSHTCIRTGVVLAPVKKQAQTTLAFQNPSQSHRSTDIDTLHSLDNFQIFTHYLHSEFHSAFTLNQNDPSGGKPRTDETESLIHVEDNFPECVRPGVGCVRPGAELSTS